MYHVIPEIQPFVRTNLASAYGRVLEDFREGEVRQEPQITDRLLARMKDAFNDVSERGVRFHTVTFADRGPGSEESRYGSDFAGFLRVDYTNYRERKFFLVQAKIGTVNDGTISLANLSSSEMDRLVSQLQRMIQITNESYLVIYTNQSFVFVPAQSIFTTRVTITHKEYWSNLGHYVPLTQTVDFFVRYFGCFIGDTNLENRVGFQVNTVDDFRSAMDALHASPRRIISFTVTIERPYPVSNNLED